MNIPPPGLGCVVVISQIIITIIIVKEVFLHAR